MGEKTFASSVPTRCVGGFSIRPPLVYGTLQFDLTLMNREQREKVFQAECLLREAGIRFDSKCENGWRDWDLGESLSGASFVIRPVKCANIFLHDPVTAPVAGIRIVAEHADGRIVPLAFCCTDCEEDYLGKLEKHGGGLKVLWRAVVPVVKFEDEVWTR